MKSKYFFLKGICFLLILQFTACSKFIEVDPPKTLLPTAEAFKNDESATSAVTGLYYLMKTLSNGIGNGTMTIYPAMSADELLKFRSTTESIQFTNNQLIATNSVVSGIWTSTYNIIGQANSCIEGLNQSGSLTQSTKLQLLGEAKVSRALLYFYLVNLYGNVPLVLTTDWKTSQSLSRTPVTQVYQQIITDLNDAISELSDNYPSNDKVRPNKYAAIALLARVYLYTKDYKNAEIASSKVIESGIYTLSDIDDVFLAASNEAIWQIQPTAGLSYDTEEGAVFIPSSDTRPPAYYLSDDLLGAFEDGDLRKSHWIGNIDYQNKTYYYPFKYKILDAANGQLEHYTILRLAETYLIRAEARIENNNISGAVSDLNTLRNRARDIASTAGNPLPDLSVNLSKDQALLSVAQERRVELFAEFGHRWFDLKRTLKTDEVLQPVKATYTPNAKLYPIPQSERLLDNNLTQNDGYN